VWWWRTSRLLQVLAGTRGGVIKRIEAMARKPARRVGLVGYDRRLSQGEWHGSVRSDPRNVDLMVGEGGFAGAEATDTRLVEPPNLDHPDPERGGKDADSSQADRTWKRLRHLFPRTALVRTIVSWWLPEGGWNRQPTVFGAVRDWGSRTELLAHHGSLSKFSEVIRNWVKTAAADDRVARSTFVLGVDIGSVQVCRPDPARSRSLSSLRQSLGRTGTAARNDALFCVLCPRARRRQESPGDLHQWRPNYYPIVAVVRRCWPGRGAWRASARNKKHRLPH